MRPLLFSPAVALLIVGSGGGMPRAHGQEPVHPPHTSGASTNPQAARAMIKTAEARRQRAEQDLAKSRKARLRARTKLTRQVQEAYARLSEERAQAQASRAARQQVEERLARLPEATAQTKTESARLLRLIHQAAGTRLEDAHPSIERVTTTVEHDLQLRFAALEAATRIAANKEHVIGRDGRSASAYVVRLGRAAAVSVSEAASSTGLISLAPDRTARIVGPILDPEMTVAVRRVSEGRAGALALDVDGALTHGHAEPASKNTGWLAAGGFFLWPILFVGALGLVLLGERIAFFTLHPIHIETVQKVSDLLADGDIARAHALVTPPKTDLDRVLRAGIEAHGQPREIREHRLESALLEEEPRLERSLSLLGAIAGLAPLLGLLGTVTGMITTFDVISIFGTGNPRLLSGGISVALITTQVGLIVAVPALLGHAWASRAVARRQGVLEAARTALLGLNPPSSEVPHDPGTRVV